MNLFSWSDAYAPLIGRIIMGSIFLISAITKALDFDGTLDVLISTNTPYPLPFLVISISVGVLFGIALVVGFKTKVSAGILLVFTALVSFTFHTAASEQDMLMMDLSLIAGLLYMMTFGSGQFAADNRKKLRT